MVGDEKHYLKQWMVLINGRKKSTELLKVVFSFTFNKGNLTDPMDTSTIRLLNKHTATWCYYLLDSPTTEAALL